MSEMTNSDVVLAFMRAFHEQDRSRADELMSDDFVFTSPQDDHIDKSRWFERCFSSADHFDGASETLQIVEVDDVVLHRYQYRVNGVEWRSTEAIRVVDGQVREVEVYFGGAVGSP